MGSKSSKKEARPTNTKAKRITMSTNDAEAYPHYAEFMRICDILEIPKPDAIRESPSIAFHNKLMNCDRLVLTVDQKVTGWLATLDHPSEARVKKSLASQTARREARKRAARKKEAASKGPAPIVPGVPAVPAVDGRTYASVASIQAPVPVRTLNIKAMTDIEHSGI